MPIFKVSMSKIIRKHKPEFKFKVAVEALKEQKTISAICREFEICESQVDLSTFFRTHKLNRF